MVLCDTMILLTTTSTVVVVRLFCTLYLATHERKCAVKSLLNLSARNARVQQEMLLVPSGYHGTADKT